MDLSVVQTVLKDFSDFTSNVNKVFGGWHDYFDFMAQALRYLKKWFIDSEAK